jgi:protocatechuate 3,4-dioxygenase beta subunit
LDNNGIYEPSKSEFKYANGISVVLFNSGIQQNNTITDANGNYLFDGLYPGNYR